MYEYIDAHYDFVPIPGGRVTHTVTKKTEVIAREDKGQGHYVQVVFDGTKHKVPCHPDELKYVSA